MTPKSVKLQKAAQIMEFFTNICSKAIEVQSNLSRAHVDSIRLMEEVVKAFQMLDTDDVVDDSKDPQ